jgi:tetratricopeptide (TPR) repeat protein
MASNVLYSSRQVRCLGAIVLTFLLGGKVYSQTQNIADSCIHRLAFDANGSDSLRMVLLGKIAFNHRNIDSVIYYADELIAVALDHGNTTALCRGYYYKSLGYTKKTKYKEALSCLLQSVSYARVANAPNLEALAFIQMGTINNATSNNSLAIQNYRNAIYLLNGLNKPNLLAGAYLNLASVYQSINITDSAFCFFQLADSIYTINENPISAAYAKGNIGIVLADRQLLDSARVYLEVSHRILLAEEHYQAAISYRLWLSIINQNQKRFDEALSFGQ